MSGAPCWIRTSDLMGKPIALTGLSKWCIKKDGQTGRDHLPWMSNPADRQDYTQQYWIRRLGYFTTSGGGGILEFSHNQEGKIMNHEEKVLFLFKLSVETATAFKTASMQANRGAVASHSLEDRINDFYDKFEEMLDQRLNKNARK